MKKHDLLGGDMLTVYFIVKDIGGTIHGLCDSDETADLLIEYLCKKFSWKNEFLLKIPYRFLTKLDVEDLKFRDENK